MDEVAGDQVVEHDHLHQAHPSRGAGDQVQERRARQLHYSGSHENFSHINNQAALAQYFTWPRAAAPSSLPLS
jgi:hypothetical protein